MAADEFGNLFPALFSCFLIILLGYGAGRFNLINSTQSRGISTFIGTFSLPALLFKSMVELELGVVNWPFMLAVFLAKATVFVAVVALTLLLSRKPLLGSAALFAIFSTQSNDFALGYPIVKVLYGASHPELLQYIYLFAPISLLILNPIGFLLLEIDKQKRLERESRVENDEINSLCQQCTSSGICSNSNVVLQSSENMALKSKKHLIMSVLKGLVFNPIVFMVFVGLVSHFIFKGAVPSLIAEVITMLSRSYPGAALFYLGLSMVGKVGNQRGVGALVPVSLICAKILLLPILARQYTAAFSQVFGPFSPNATSAENSTYGTVLANFGFVYGTFPTAPSVAIYAAKYGLETDQMATGMVVCTILSAPIMYVAAWSLMIPHMKIGFYLSKVVEIDRDISIIGFLCAIWCIVIFVLSRKFKKVPHFITLALTVAMLIGAVFAVVIDTYKTQSYYGQVVLFSLFYCGVKATRLLSASLALALVVLKRRGENKVWKFGWLFVGVPVVVAVILTLVVVLCGTKEENVGNPVFLFGGLQDIISFAVLTLSTITTIICLIILFRLPNVFEDTPASHRYSLLDNNSESSGDSIPLTDADISSESSSNFEEEIVVGCAQITRHIVLLLFLTLSMIIGVVLTGWRLSSSPQTGVFFEISFLDSAFNFGQAFVVFILFGLDSQLVLEPVLKMWRKLCCGNELPQPPLHEVEKEVLRLCLVFTKHHLEHCRRDLEHTEERGLRRYSRVLRGSDFCSWLVEVGLVADRGEAVQYGKQLMTGRVLNHIKNQHYFCDNNYLYKFETRKQSLTDSLQTSTSSNGDSRTNLEGCRRLQTPSFSFEKYLTADDMDGFVVASPSRKERAGVTRHHLNSKPSSEIEQCHHSLERATESLQAGSSAPRVVKALVRSKPLDGAETSLLDW